LRSEREFTGKVRKRTSIGLDQATPTRKDAGESVRILTRIWGRRGTICPERGKKGVLRQERGKQEKFERRGDLNYTTRVKLEHSERGGKF